MINKAVSSILRLISQGVYAQDDPIVIPIPTEDPPTFEKLIVAVLFIIGKIGPAIGLFAFGMVIYGGYLWITSGGEAQKKQKAQATLTWSIVGLVFFYLIRMFLNWILDWI